MRVAVIRRPNDLVVGIMGEKRARWANEQRRLAQRRERYRWHATGFDLAGDQSHGLVADGSDGDKQGSIRLLLKDVFGDGGGKMIYYLGPVWKIPAEADVGLGESANFSSSD